MTDKNKQIGILDYKVIVLFLLFLFPLLIFFLTFFFWSLDRMLDDSFVSFSHSFSSHTVEILVLSISLWAIAIFYMSGTFKVLKPKKTTTLASAEWIPIKKQKEEFKTAQIDTSVELEKGGAPVNKISETEILYDVMPMHDLAMGITRSGKSRKIVRQLVMLASMANEAMIFNDPKKEMYQDFHIYLEKKGYDVYVLDFRKQEVSNGWNPLDDITYQIKMGNIDDADQYAEDQVTSLVVDNGTGEPIWIEGQKALIKSLIMEVCMANIPDEKKNYYSIVQAMSILGKETKIDGESKMLLTAYMESLDETSPSRVSYTPIVNAPDKTRGSFMTTSLATMHPFTGQKLAKVLSHSDFNFHDFKDGKKALFVVNPDEKTTYNAITAMVYDNAYQSLIFEANQLSGRKLNKRVHMIFDEFGNMPKINKLESKLTVSLSREILFHLYLQDFKQMNEIYGDNVASIIRGNCALWYFISSGDYDTCEEMSKKIGEETIWVDSIGGNYNERSNVTGGNINQSQQARRLIDANELLKSDMRNGHGIIAYRLYLGPCKVNLPDCSDYAWYKEMEHDETEIPNKDLKLSYAIPRYIVINQDILRDSGYSPKPISNAPMSIPSNRRPMPQTPQLKSKDMYWYWSTRDDLESVVTKHVIEWMKETKAIPERSIIQDYMKSEKFIEWLWSVDKTKADASEEDQKVIDTVVKSTETEMAKMYDNALSEMWD